MRGNETSFAVWSSTMPRKMASSRRFLRDGGKEAFDSIGPGSRDRRDMGVK
jgi:hypothetical protein